MGTYCFNFLDLPTADFPSPEPYERYFINYNPEDWSRGCCGGSFVYVADDGSRFALTVSQHSDYGISLNFSRKTGNQLDSWLSVGDHRAFTARDFVDTGDGILWPRGSFISPERAWSAISKFIENPYDPPGADEWIDEKALKDLKWPHQ